MTRQLLQWSQSMMHLLTDLGKWQGLGGSSLQWHRSIMVNMSSFVLISLGPWYTSAPMKPVKQALPHSMLPQPAVIDTKPARMPQLPFIESLQAAAFPTAFRLLIYIIWIICHISSYYIYAHSWVDLYTELQIHSQVHQDMHSTFSSSNRTVQSCGMCHPLRRSPGQSNATKGHDLRATSHWYHLGPNDLMLCGRDIPSWCTWWSRTYWRHELSAARQTWHWHAWGPPQRIESFPPWQRDEHIWALKYTKLT